MVIVQFRLRRNIRRKCAQGSLNCPCIPVPSRVATSAKYIRRSVIKRKRLSEKRGVIFFVGGDRKKKLAFFEKSCMIRKFEVKGNRERTAYDIE